MAYVSAVCCHVFSHGLGLQWFTSYLRVHVSIWLTRCIQVFRIQKVCYIGSQKCCLCLIQSCKAGNRSAHEVVDMIGRLSKDVRA